MLQQRIVIVGAGIVGLATAYALLKQGIEHVTVIEQAQVDHPGSTSHGLSRLLRFEYGNDLFYSQMVGLSLQRWQSLERAAQRTLFTPTGLLTLGNEDDNFTLPSYHVLREIGLQPERLSRRSCAQRFPQFETQRYNTFTYNEIAGILYASSCLQIFKELILDLGGRIVEGQRATHITHDNQLRPLRVSLSGGNELLAERVVLAIGPWIHHLLGDLQLPIRLTRQYILYFDDLPISSYQLHTFPAFMVDDLYGFPLHNTCTDRGPCWLKATSHSFGASVEPDDLPAVNADVIEQIRQKLCDVLPALRSARLAQVDACIYDVSPDENFILDYLPYDRRVVFATGLSGHGFKFGPLLGELISSLVLDREPVLSLQRFRVSRFLHQRQAASSVA